MEELHRSRDRHLFGPGRKRILALDGGGVRGAMSIAFLERLEQILAAIAGKPVRLCDYFDLIGGTSTGAIIAAGLALGLSAADMKELYNKLAPKVFKSSLWRLPLWSAKFDARTLQSELNAVFGERTLDSEELLTGFCVVLKRIDTGGSWVLLNNPRAKYWNSPSDHSFLGNAQLHLANLIRASTAAPSYFDPELIQIVDGQVSGLFVDGGLTPHNNPSLALFLSAVLPPYGINWPLGVDNLSIVSVGTGTYRTKLSLREVEKAHAVGLAVSALVAQMDESQRLMLLLMSWLGQTSTCWSIDSELGDVGPIQPPFGPLFRFNRLDVLLEENWLDAELGVKVSPAELASLREMDTPLNIPTLYGLGQKAAAIQLQRDEVATW